MVELSHKMIEGYKYTGRVKRVGDAGLADYGQCVNSSGSVALGVFDKRAGAARGGPVDLGTLWRNGSDCEFNEPYQLIDPVLLYDQSADRWVLVQFTSLAKSDDYVVHVAVSTSSDPLGSYYLEIGWPASNARRILARSTLCAVAVRAVLRAVDSAFMSADSRGIAR